MSKYLDGKAAQIRAKEGRMTAKEARDWLDKTVIGNLDAKAVIDRALEKQIPKKPIKDSEFVRCPVCRERMYFIWDYKEQRALREEFYCDQCGQAIDWREE